MYYVLESGYKINCLDESESRVVTFRLKYFVGTNEVSNRMKLRIAEERVSKISYEIRVRKR